MTITNNKWLENTNGDVERQTNLLLFLVVSNCPLYMKLTPKKEQSWIENPINVYLGFVDNMKGYCLWDPITYKVVITKDTILLEN